MRRSISMRGCVCPSVHPSVLESIGCFLKRFSINVKKNYKKKWRKIKMKKDKNLVQVQELCGVYFCIKWISKHSFYGGHGLLNVWFWWFWQWPNITKTCSEIALVFLGNQNWSKKHQMKPFLKNHPITNLWIPLRRSRSFRRRSSPRRSSSAPTPPSSSSLEASDPIQNRKQLHREANRQKKCASMKTFLWDGRTECLEDRRDRGEGNEGRWGRMGSEL